MVRILFRKSYYKKKVVYGLHVSVLPNQVAPESTDGQPAPIMSQPVAGFADRAQGLDILKNLDQLHVKQKMETFEAVMGWETKNKYEIMDASAKVLFKAEEESSGCGRHCIGSERAFNIKLRDSTENEVIQLERPWMSDSCCCPCCLQRMEVSTPDTDKDPDPYAYVLFVHRFFLQISAPPGNVIGFLQQEWDPCVPKFTIRDADDNTIMRIDGPWMTYGGFGNNVDFTIKEPEGETELGKITKKWTGMMKETFSDSDNFGLSFPATMDVKSKALLLGALFLMDYMYYEGRGGD